MRYGSRLLLVTLFMVAATGTPLVAAEGSLPEPPEMITDRPDATESAAIVPGGYFQVEMGWTHALFDEDGVETTADSFPETLVRIGLSSRVELRLGFDGYEWDRETAAGADSSTSDGFNDSSLGVKVGLFEEKGARPQMAFLGGISLPSGAEELTDSRVVPAISVAFANTLTERLSLGYNLGIAWFTETDANGEKRTSSVALWTVALGIGITEKLGAYVEFYGNPVVSALESASSTFNGGFTYLIRRNVQLDISGGVGLSGGAPDWLAGLGVSFRLPR